MLKLHYETSVRNTRFWTDDMPVESDAINQIRNIAALPIVSGHVAVMPDVHLGKGATVGSVIPTRGAVIPAAVGVDIGCGMAAVRTQLRASDLPESLKDVRLAVEAVIPVGFDMNKQALRAADLGGDQSLVARMKALEGRFAKLAILSRLGSLVDEGRIWRQISSLGGGNHFIEMNIDETNDVWMMLHSGSRNIGKLIGECAIEMAKEYVARESIKLVDRDLAWLAEGTAEFDAYIEAMRWAQDYAALNRDMMMRRYTLALGEALGRPIMHTFEAVNCHHNFTTVEEHFGEKHWITRKGAVRAGQGELGIIPGSMGAKSFIVRGRGHHDAYCSCSHGAGRKMSRGAAKRAFTEADLAIQTAGIECRKDAGVVDEIPGAYKDIDAVMAAQAELVETLHTLRQVMCIKG